MGEWGGGMMGFVDQHRAADMLALYILHHEGEVLGKEAGVGEGGGVAEAREQVCVCICVWGIMFVSACL